MNPGTDHDDQHLFQTTFYQSVVGMALVSLSGEWLLVNNKFCDVVGHKREELLNMTFHQVTQSDALQSEMFRVQKVFRGEIQSYTCETQLVRKDQSQVWIGFTVNLAKDDGGLPLHFVLVAEDIDRRKKLESQLCGINEKMKSINGNPIAGFGVELSERQHAKKPRYSFYDLSSDLIGIFGYDGYVKAANPALIKCLGYSKDELSSRQFIEFIHPDDLDRTLKATVEFQKTGQFAGIENRYICKNGNVVTLSWTVTEIPEDDCIYAIARDVTDVRRQELEISEQKLKIAANSKMNALGRMASGIAHEINNPLTIVYGQTSALKKMATEGTIDRANISTIAHSMEKMCDRIIGIINGLRTFSRDATNDPFEFYSAAKLLNETLSFCHGRMQSYGIGLVVDPISEDIEFYCSPVQISQVILNLLNNSIDALKDLNSKRIQIRLVVESEKIGLAISDSGVGVKKEHIPNLFTPFFTTKEIGKGTGLGLSIAKGIIDAHHGNIYYDSSCAETRFVFLLPRVSDL